MVAELEIAPEDAEFQDEIRTWLDEHLVGEFARHRGVGSPTDDSAWDVRVAWEKELSAGGWLGLGWPVEYGGRGATPAQEIVFEYEYAKAAAPARVGTQALELLGPSLLAHGTEAQKARFLPPILAVEEMWGQGFSEPGAGSDLASVQTRAVREGDEWVIHGQKVWTTFGHHADWLYVLCRTDPDRSLRHRGLTLLLVPVDQAGVRISPIRNIAGSAEFSECFFDGARTSADLVVGEVNGGWKVVMGTLAMERGSALLPMQLAMQREVDEVVRTASRVGVAGDARMRQRLADAYIATRVMRATTLRVIASIIEDKQETTTAAATVSKLFAATEHQKLGELAMDLRGDEAMVTAGVGHEGLDAQQKSFLLSRAETIYGGTAEIQRNIIAERVLGLPR
ncbi:acyl-CoA dehydrogenase family protein [Nocardia sp. alder85J]|uniref:acyl-CoA dehydrogenase family protein n=1 Tax=Nocardia sp. alder85J TaxID=2862949 RepID=UPI001CD33D16|nr:acyl-CoA dehydrogenase family protein [Nocardia sp. alder85J]MCX4095740.1 acyl-CoA dehydrogenase family protein [Nocardia sp. alder85J]